MGVIPITRVTNQFRHYGLYMLLSGIVIWGCD